MTRTIRMSILGAATVAATTAAVVPLAVHAPASPAATSHVADVTLSAGDAPPRLEPSARPLPRPASRSRALPPKPKRVAPRRAVAPPHRPVTRRPSSGNGCNDGNWRSQLSGDERWIDMKESSLNPLAQNAHSTASGLGQLLDSTYRLIGMTKDLDPCHEIAAQRRYMRSTYGSWAKARAHWESHSSW